MFARGAAVKQYHTSILRYKLTTLLRCAGRSFLASPRKEPKKATWGRRSDCAVVTLLHFGTTPDSPNSPSPKTPSQRSTMVQHAFQPFMERVQYGRICGFREDGNGQVCRGGLFCTMDFGNGLPRRAAHSSQRRGKRNIFRLNAHNQKQNHVIARPQRGRGNPYSLQCVALLGHQAAFSISAINLNLQGGAS